MFQWTVRSNLARLSSLSSSSAWLKKHTWNTSDSRKTNVSTSSPVKSSKTLSHLRIKSNLAWRRKIRRFNYWEWVTLCSWGTVTMCLRTVSCCRAARRVSVRRSYKQMHLMVKETLRASCHWLRVKSNWHNCSIRRELECMFQCQQTIYMISKAVLISTMATKNSTKTNSIEPETWAIHSLSPVVL